MGTDLLSTVAHMDGIVVAAVATRTPTRVFDAAALAYGEDGHVREIENAHALTQTIEQGLIAATDDLDLVLHHEQIDIIVDATGYPEAGAKIGIKALENNKHLVMMNVEADVTIGTYLKHEAEKRGLIYTLGAGDEPTSCMELIEFVSALGHKIVAAGKGKNNPLLFDATPDAYEEEALRRNMNVRMLVEFIDGSKTMVEMAAIANATGLLPDCPGMHGPQAALQDLSKVLIPKQDGGIFGEIWRCRLLNRPRCFSRCFCHCRNSTSTFARTYGRFKKLVRDLTLPFIALIISQQWKFPLPVHELCSMVKKIWHLLITPQQKFALLLKKIYILVIS